VKFAPAPPNDFQQFYETYYERCREQCPFIVGLTGKWTFEDLIPGLSDFDTRFVVRDDVTVADWHHMSLAVGRVHTDLAKEVPHWARNLEHLPGVNLTVSELSDPRLYYPEFKMWTFYLGDCKEMQDHLEAKPWTPRDEAFHLKKIATYFGPYQRGIDPPVNMGPWENKYPLHSRFMHYFAPPVMSAVAIKRKNPLRGKLDALRHARELFPNPQVIDLTFDVLDRHYEVESLYNEPQLSELEAQLENYLQEMWASMSDDVTQIQVDSADTRQSLQQKVGVAFNDAVEAFLDGARFCRLMKGRLLFYAEKIDWFESTWLVRNELGRIVSNFYERPMRAYAQVCWQESLEPDEVLERLADSILTEEQARSMRAFVIEGSKPVEDGQEREQARRIATIYEDVLAVLETLRADIVERLQAIPVR